MLEAVRAKVGVFSPMAIIDNTPYEFYRMAPPGVMLVILPLGIRRFEREDVERVFAPLGEHLDQLMPRGIDLYFQAGVPLQLAMGIEAHDARLARIETRTGKPAISSITGAVAAAKQLGLRNIVLVNRFTEAMNATLADFFRRDGVNVAGVSSPERTRKRMMTPGEIKRMDPEENLNAARALCRQAFQTFPAADGLYIGGGSWLLTPIIREIETEFGSAVIGHQDAKLWDILRMLGMWRPIPGYGRLLSSER